IPGKILPIAKLLSGETRTLRKSIDHPLTHRVDQIVELSGRRYIVDHSPQQRLVGRDRLAGQKQLSSTALTDEKRQPVRASYRCKTNLCLDLYKLCVVDRDCEIACEVPLVPAAGDYPIDPRDRRLTELAQRCVRFDQRIQPFANCIWVTGR